MAEPVERYIITPHAALEMERRKIAEEIVCDVLAEPEQRHPVRPGRAVLQSQIASDGKMYLVRVFVDIDRSPAEIVTVYLTSKVAKYWREAS